MSEITGVGFYESLNKFFVGFLILVLFVGLDLDLFINPLFLISAYIVGCIYQALVQVCTKSMLSLQKNEIEEVRNKVYKNKYKGINIKDDYLKAYYKVAKAGLLMNIPVLEALENFMRNLIFIIPYYFTCFILKDHISFFEGVLLILRDFQKLSSFHKIELIVFLILAFWGVIILCYYYQQTIYRLVWEGNKYLDEIDKDSKLEEMKIRRDVLNVCHIPFFECTLQDYTQYQKGDASQ